MFNKVKFSEIKNTAMNSIHSLPNITMLEKAWKMVDQNKFWHAFKQKVVEYARDFWFLLCRGDCISLTLWNIILYSALYFALGVSVTFCVAGFLSSYFIYFFLEWYEQMRFFDVVSSEITKEIIKEVDRDIAS